MFRVDFSHYGYNSGKIVFIEDALVVESLDEAIALAPAADCICLLNRAATYIPEVLRIAHQRMWAADSRDEWLGARFESCF